MNFEIIERIPLDSVAPRSRLGLAYLRGDPSALPFYRFGPEDFGAAAEVVLAGKTTGRKELCDVLGEINATFGADPSTMAAIGRLRNRGTLAVVTGQQTSPLTGPYYTILKAATAVRLCRTLREKHGLECVPVFWAEGDDHDTPEVSTLTLGRADGEWRDLAVHWSGEAAGKPIGDLTASWEDLEAEVAAQLPATEFKAAARGLLFEGAVPGKSLGEWFCALLLKLFASHGLVVAYSRDRRLRLLWRELIPRVLEESPSLMEELSRVSENIKNAGFRPQLHKTTGQSPFFIIEQGVRTPVRHDGRHYLAGRAKLSRGELESQFGADPASFSPGVLLRAVIQDSLLPTVAYIGGLAETAYFGQLKGFYDRLGVVMPLIHPRLSATFVEPGQERILRKHSLAPSRFLGREPGKVFAEVISARKGPAGEKTWRSIESRSRAPILRYRERLPAGMEPMKGYLDNVAGRIGHLVREAEERMTKAIRGGEEEVKKQVTDTGRALFPAGELMERKVNIAYYLCKYGTDFVGRLMENFPDDLLCHHFISLRGKG